MKAPCRLAWGVRSVIMDNYLKRQVYDCLLTWKNHSEHSTLEVSGARQVGKTYYCK